MCPLFGSVGLRFRGGTVRPVPVFGSSGSFGGRGVSVFQHRLAERDGSGSGFRFLENGSDDGPVPGITVLMVPTVLVSGSGSVPEPP